MTGSSWFRGSRKPTLKDTMQCLFPQPQPADDHRFSQLLLEHGETRIQDWAVQASSFPIPEDQMAPDTEGNSQIQWEQSPHRKRRKSRYAASSSSSELNDISKDSYPSAHMSKLKGRLHLCSRSLVFEPDDVARAIVRCPRDNHPTTRENVLELRTKKHTSMKENNAIGPFVPVASAVVFQFTFLHSSPTELLERMENENVTKESCSFDPDHLVSIREVVRTHSMRASILTPLQRTPGVLVVTGERIYLQKADNRVQCWSLSHIVAAARRYNGLRDCAVEVYWKDRTSTLLALERRHEREQVLRVLPTDVPCFTDRSFVCDVMQEWQKKELSNLEYLLALNAASGRSFHDLSRYPVLPWVIADYKSEKLDLNKPETFRDLTKPVGALQSERLEYFQQRWSHMQDMGEEDQFLYGTHYSAPGYVLYYLVRSMPEHMLCLQNGKFDAADRMFHSVAHCFNCAMTNHADVKELIPEFYVKDFDFLLNTRGLSLGATQSGDRVDDVVLPPWARSARHFLSTNRKALESEYCTKHISAWIDLVFGSLSRGEAATKASNLFHPTAYLGPHDLADMQTEAEREQAELQATEFGIVPDQLFVERHPCQGEKFNEETISVEIGRANSKQDDSIGREAWELLDAPSSHENSAVDPMETERMSNQIVPTSTVDIPKTQLGNTNAFAPERPSMRDTTNESPASPVIQPFPSHASSVQWDMNMLDRNTIHSDAISGCVLRLDPGDNSQPILVTTSLDGGLKVHNITLTATTKDQGGFSSTLSRLTLIGRGNSLHGGSTRPKLSEYRNHASRDPLASLVLAEDGGGGAVAFAGGHDDIVLAYGVNSACAMASVYSHRDAVTGLDLIPRTPFIKANSLWRENSTHLLVSGSFDATVKVWSVSVAGGETVSVDREPMAELVDADSSIVSISAKALPMGGIVVTSGCADGSFSVWNIYEDCVQVVLHKEVAKRGSGPCSVVHWVSHGGNLFLFTAFSTGKVASYALVDGNRLESRNAVSVGVAILSMSYSNGFLLVGCSDGGLRLISIREGCFFDAKPTLWKAVNKEAAPGLTSMSIAYTVGDEGGRCICCTGGDDGSLALFELKKRASATS